MGQVTIKEAAAQLAAREAEFYHWSDAPVMEKQSEGEGSYLDTIKQTLSRFGQQAGSAASNAYAGLADKAKDVDWQSPATLAALGAAGGGALGAVGGASSGGGIFGSGLRGAVMGGLAGGGLGLGAQQLQAYRAGAQAPNPKVQLLSELQRELDKDRDSIGLPTTTAVGVAAGGIGASTAAEQLMRSRGLGAATGSTASLENIYGRYGGKADLKDAIGAAATNAGSRPAGELYDQLRAHINHADMPEFLSILERPDGDPGLLDDLSNKIREMRGGNDAIANALGISVDEAEALPMMPAGLNASQIRQDFLDNAPKKWTVGLPVGAAKAISSLPYLSKLRKPLSGITASGPAVLKGLGIAAPAALGLDYYMGSGGSEPAQAAPDPETVRQVLELLGQG